MFRNDDERARADKWGITDYDKIYTTDELAKPGNVMFAATGVTSGTMLPGVRRYRGGATTHSVKSGVAHVTSANDIECLEDVKKLLSYLPQSNKEKDPQK